MTPPARIAAAIAILDDILSGMPAEQALTGWARRNRFAGSGDRAAIRDHVFDAIRRRRSYAALGGSESGRGLMIGALRQAGQSPDEVFNGGKYAPDRLSDAEAGFIPVPLSQTEALDVPDWILPQLRKSLGACTDAVLRALRDRAPVFLRVNRTKATRAQAIERLASEGIQSQPHALASQALEVTDGARKIRTSATYREGWVELQDAASQAVVERLLPLPNGARVLDYCAGGGGKTLAIAAEGAGTIVAHDANPGRMRDLPDRARRAGARVTIRDTGALEGEHPFDLVLVDAPCSGSGAWRRQPASKWDLTAEDLRRLTELQAEILDQAAGYVGETGRLAYATCSMLLVENSQQVSGFLDRNPVWQRGEPDLNLTPLDGGDGFFLAQLQRKTF